MIGTEGKETVVWLDFIPVCKAASVGYWWRRSSVPLFENWNYCRV